MPDQETLDVYAKRAEDYAARFVRSTPSRHLQAFIDALPAQAHVLDLGCGPGDAAAHMISAGLTADAWDASPEMAAQGQQNFGLDIQVAAFDDLNLSSVYDGIYANFSLLHARKSDMPRHLTQIAQALKPGGLFHIGLKSGSGEKRDGIGRFYAFYTDAELTGLLETAGFQITSRVTGEEAGLDGQVAPWIIMRARKND